MMANAQLPPQSGYTAPTFPTKTYCAEAPLENGDTSQYSPPTNTQEPIRARGGGGFCAGLTCATTTTGADATTAAGGATTEEAMGGTAADAAICSWACALDAAVPISYAADPDHSLLAWFYITMGYQGYYQQGNQQGYNPGPPPPPNYQYQGGPYNQYNNQGQYYGPPQQQPQYVYPQGQKQGGGAAGVGAGLCCGLLTCCALEELCCLC
ncbi:hypothetical protein GGI26_000666 [Coemansia sp. RSA 1358]|uniref:Cysteine-rich transmembrane CYSTM domain-containing protein n=1 Tax=Coemansia umbellata TaxID=1424467 RepID=A0ABQ8PUX2_9FUNG|nr:hypothetical protein BX070DRAFT_254290 [Coemansia spiralis]KAJ1996082.1 hypothetical protein EDC05_000451 [Coemansia umbellata]KAJ2625525.1 hypothetical protein GGI26_000666 [Coemansia sp. RSA 1358]